MIGIRIMIIFLGVGGLFLMGIENWEVALGAFLFIWSNNMATQLK